MDDKRIASFCRRYLADIQFEPEYIVMGADYRVPIDIRVTLVMPHRLLETLVETEEEARILKSEHNMEEYLRSNFPTLQDAYDKYRMLLNFYRN